MTFFLSVFAPVLPDGIFSNQKIPIWVNFGGTYNGRIFKMAIWYILWPHGTYIVLVIWYTFHVFTFNVFV
jgi:hypothetical protein